MNKKCEHVLIMDKKCCIYATGCRKSLKFRDVYLTGTREHPILGTVHVSRGPRVNLGVFPIPCETVSIFNKL